MITIITRPPSIFSIANLKDRVKEVLIKKGGPYAVKQSIVIGLKEIGISLRINPIFFKKTDIVNVLSGIEALRWAIKKKEQGLIKTLIAGPNLVITPTDHDSILANPNIDIVLVNSEWTRNFYSSTLPIIKNKIFIWPAGVSIPPLTQLSQERSGCLVFKKDVEKEIFEKVVSVLRSKNIKFSVFEYGKFKQKDYFKFLEKSESMIYLQRVESQGLALQEAWARDVPTLVWNPGSFTYKSGETVTGNISAPFLTDQAGIFFKSCEDFTQNLEIFRTNLKSYTPRLYCEQNLSNKASAEIYVKILESINQQ